MREEEPKKSLERFIIKYTGDSSRVQFPLQTDAAEVAAVAGARPLRELWITAMS